MSKSYLKYVLLAAVFCLSVTAVSAADFCKSYNYSSKKVAFNDLRETTIPATGNLQVDGGRNGGISVKGSNRSDILIRSCVRTWGESEADAKSKASNIKIATSPKVHATNTPEKGWSVSFEIHVPRSTGLNLNANNGGIKISSVQGNLQFTTRNGGVRLDGVSGDVKGTTRNGGVSVNLSGTSWRGGGLDVETRNGGVKVTMAKNYSANVELGTVNGGFKSDFAELRPVKKNRWHRPKRVSASLNGGGAKIRVVTTNGGVRINASADL